MFYQVRNHIIFSHVHCWRFFSKPAMIFDIINHSKNFAAFWQIRYQRICKPSFENFSIHVAMLIDIWFWKSLTTHEKGIWYRLFTTSRMAYDNIFSFRQWCWKGIFCCIVWPNCLSVSTTAFWLSVFWYSKPSLFYQMIHPYHFIK